MSNLDPLEIVNRPSIVKEQNTGMLAPKQYAGTSWKDLERQRLAGGGLQLGQDFVNQDMQGRTDDRNLRGFEFGVGEDVVGYDKGYVSSDFENQRRMSAEGQLGTFQDAGTSQRLGALGLQQNYKQNQYKGYKYNSATGKYDYYDNTPSNLDVAIPALIKAGVMSAATMGLGGALTPALGAVGGKAAAAGLMSAAQGGDIKDIAIDAFTAGLSEKVKTLNVAAEAVGATKEAIQQAETFNTIKDVVNLAEAVASGDVVGSVLKGMDLAGLPSVTEMVGDTVTDLFPDSEFLASGDNLKAFTGGIVKAGIKIAGGGAPGQAIASGIWDYVKNGGELPNVDISLGDYEGWDTPEWMRELDSETLQPIKDAFVVGYQTLNQNVLNPIEELASDTAGVVREVGRDVREFADPLANDVRQVGRDLRGIDLPDLNIPSFDLQGLSLGGGRGGSIGNTDLANIELTDPELVGGFEYDNLYNYLLDERTI